jgi:hypothetical protein
VSVCRWFCAYSENSPKTLLLLICRLSKRRPLPKDHNGSGKLEASCFNDINEQGKNNAAETSAHDDALRSKLSESILSLRANLTLFLDIEYGLLDDLCARRVITSQQIEEIRKSTLTDGAAYLLNLVSEMSDESQQQFLAALDDNQQAHISEYIRINGDLSKVKRDRWPLPLCDEMKSIEKNRAKIIEMTDLKCGLLDELFAVGFLNDLQMKSIKDKEEAVQSRLLLDLMYSVSFADCKEFLSCLEKTKQCAVISLMSTSYACSERPLNDVRKSRLRRHRAHLVELIDLKHGLLAELYGSGCVTSRQKQFIESAESKADSNARLLDILRRGSEEDFNMFIDCLLKTRQQRLVNLLQEDGAVMPVDAVTRCSASEEIRIADRIMDVIADSVSNRSDAERMNVFAEVVERLNVHLIHAKKQNSIGLFYFCLSLDGLQHLYELFSSGRLKEIVERIFTVLLNNGMPVVVDRLRWDNHDYLNCLQYLYSAAELEVFYELYALPTNTHLDLVDSIVSSLRVDQLPSEMLQLILNKAMSQLFVIIHRVTPRAAVYAMATVGGVSTTWWRTITYSTHSKQVLKRYFKRFWSPFKRHPQRLQCQRIEGNADCLTEFNGQLYVGVCGSASVQVFESRSPFSRLYDIKVEGLISPWDIVVCGDTSQLYIAEGLPFSVIRRVNLLCIKDSDVLISVQWGPRSLSVNSRRLLITPEDGAELFLYNNEGSQLNCIKLPDYMLATHAVETTHNTYIVSHFNRRIGDTDPEFHSVSEVNVDGRVVRTFHSQHIDIGSIQFKRPEYMALDDNNHVIVVDQHNERVVVLKSDLQLKRVLIQSLGQLPTNVCLSKSTGLLFITYMNSPDIEIYKVLS